LRKLVDHGGVILVHRIITVFFILRDDVKLTHRNLVSLGPISLIKDIPQAVCTYCEELNFMPLVFVFSFTYLDAHFQLNDHSDRDSVSSLIFSSSILLDLLLGTAAKNSHIARTY